VQPISEILDGYIASEVSKQTRAVFELRKAWEQVVDPKIKEYTGAAVYDQKNADTVIVYTAGGIHMVELEADKELYRLRLNEILRPNRPDPIKDIRFMVDRKIASSKADARLTTAAVATAVSPVPLSAEEERHAREKLTAIHNTELKQSLYKAMKTTSEWKNAKEANKTPQKPY
jgi:hypothetical protein